MKVSNGPSHPPSPTMVKNDQKEIEKEAREESLAALEPVKDIVATGTGISIKSKMEADNILQRNDPADPLVAKKILDSLSLGFINFSQQERDAIAKILNEERGALYGPLKG